MRTFHAPGKNASKETKVNQSVPSTARFTDSTYDSILLGQREGSCEKITHKEGRTCPKSWIKQKGLLRTYMICNDNDEDWWWPIPTLLLLEGLAQRPWQCSILAFHNHLQSQSLLMRKFFSQPFVTEFIKDHGSLAFDGKSKKITNLTMLRSTNPMSFNHGWTGISIVRRLSNLRSKRGNLNEEKMLFTEKLNNLH